MTAYLKAHPGNGNGNGKHDAAVAACSAPVYAPADQAYLRTLAAADYTVLNPQEVINIGRYTEYMIGTGATIRRRPGPRDRDRLADGSTDHVIRPG